MDELASGAESAARPLFRRIEEAEGRLRRGDLEDLGDPLRRLQRDQRAAVEHGRPARRPRQRRHRSRRSSSASRRACTPSRSSAAARSSSSRPRRSQAIAEARSLAAAPARASEGLLPRSAWDLLGGGAAAGGGRQPASSRSPGDDPRAVEAVEAGEADRAFVPFENSIEGTVRPTLDALAFDADRARDRRRVRPRVHAGADRGAPASSTRSRSSSPIRRRPRSARAFSASELRRGRDPLDGRAPGGGQAGRRRPRAVGGARLRRRPPGLRRRRPPGGRRGRGGQRHPLRLAPPARRTGPAGRNRGPGGRRWSSASSAPTVPARWPRRSESSPTAAST